MPFIQAPVKPNPPLNLTGKTIIITGANAGLGFESARQLLLGKASTMILACRNLSKGETARNLLLSDPGIAQTNPSAVIKVMKLDTESYTSAIELADRVKKEIADLHILLLNAGIGSMKFEKNPTTGHEKVTQVNYLSNALLALELLPLLEATAAKENRATRMTWVGSRTHMNDANLDKTLHSKESVLDRFDDKSRYSAMSHYGNTKLLCVMFVAELAKRVSGEKVVVNSLCPGMVKTGMSDVLPVYLRLPMNLVLAMRARTVEQGGWLVVNAAAVAGKETHGRFLNDRDVVGPAEFLNSAKGKDVQTRCWNETIEEVVGVDNRLAGVVAA